MTPPMASCFPPGSVQVPVRMTPQVKHSYLESIANRTGGQFIMAANTTQLNKIYREIQNSLMKSYIITYKVNEEAESRYLELREKESSVRARKRYSAAETQQSSTVSTGGLQEAGYYKQTGGTDRR